MSNSNSKPIQVLVSGALGRMGVEVIKAIDASEHCQLVAAIDTTKGMEGKDIGEVIGIGAKEVFVTSDFEASLCSSSQNQKTSDRPVLIDFTHPSVVYEHTRASIAYGVHPVIGTTGLSRSQIKDLSEFAIKASIGSAIIPNFSIGMVLLQQAAAAAARFYENVELIEMHHNLKADSPSGTCIKTAEMIEELGKTFNESNISDEESIKGSRGGHRPSGLRLHSVRLPGLVAHQEVMFGAPGETYLLKHDTIDRSAYMPGVLLTVRKVQQINGLLYGLEKIL